MLNLILENIWFLFCVFLAGFFNAVMDHFDFRRPYNNGFWSLHTLGSRKDVWHLSKVAMVLCFVFAATVLEFDPERAWHDYAQVIFWSGLVWAASHELFYKWILRLFL